MKKVFLIGLIGLAVAACTSKPKATEKNKVPVTLVEMNLKVEGMTCDECEASIAKGSISWPVSTASVPTTKIRLLLFGLTPQKLI